MACYILDRFEQNIAVIEATNEQDESSFLELKRTLLPVDAAEGDVLEKTEDGWKINKEETLHRRERIRMLLRQITEEA